MKSWDYIIVGAGSAGCVLANRLSADASRSVLLLEAGGKDWSPFIHVPAAIIKAIGNPKLDWCYPAEPDPSRNDRVDLWPAGKVLGGSSAINGMLHVRGRSQDYDRWRDSGCPGWGSDEVMPVFKRIEASTVGDPQIRGRSGPLRTRPLRSTHPLAHTFVAAAQEHGVPFNPDYNGRSQYGIAYSEVTQSRGWRYTAARAYLKPAQSRRNLTVRTRTTAQKLIFEQRTCRGVRVENADGSVEDLRANCEVVVCAGAIATPKLLMLSGIGPGQHLGELGIEVIVDRPGVGANLQEHPEGMVGIDVNVSTYNTEINSWKIVLHTMNWLFFGRGPATSPYPHAVGFLKTDPTLKEADIEVQLGPYAFTFSEEGVLPYPRPAISAAISPCYPQSRGRITLRSDRSDDKPRIEHALLASEQDMKTLVAGCRMVREIFASSAFDTTRIADRLPGEAIQSDDEWKDYLRRTAFLGYHPSGTCRMGSDAEAVTTPRLKVNGVDHLRVADASIMPKLTSGNTNGPVMMIGERCADLIAADRS